MNFKFFEKKETVGVINLNDYWETRNDTITIGETSPSRVLYIQPIRYENVEFCFQFNDDNPIVFANTAGNSCTIHLEPTTNSNMIFNDGNGNVFKLFARQIENGNQRV